MESILDNISKVVGITIIHSLWQGLVIYLVLRIVFIVIPSLLPVKKYNMAIISMFLISLWFTYTLYAEIQSYNWIFSGYAQPLSLLPYLKLTADSGQIPRYWYNDIANYLPYISIFYIAGLLTNVGKLVLEWNRIKIIKKSLIPAEQMQQFINTFSKKLGIKKHVQIKFSHLIDVPCVSGYLKPIIFLPVSLATGLTAWEIEAILLHELSHIKRKDYLVNLLQQFIAILLFFNPFAQLINQIINKERENSCDDMVIEKTENPLIYACALLKLEETRQSSLRLTLSATGKRYHLLNRIERIMKAKQPTENFKHLLMILLLLAGSVSAIAWFNPATDGKKSALKVKKQLFTTNSSARSKSENIVGNAPAAFKIKHAKFILKNDNKQFPPVTDTSKDNKITEQHPDSSANFVTTPELQNQMDTIRKHSDEIRKHFNNAQWKSQMDAIRKQGEEMKKHFNSQKWKNQMLVMRKQGEEMRKQFESPEWKSQMDAIRIQGEEMKKQFDGPQWKSQMDAMRKQGEEMKKQFDSQGWKNQMLAMQKQGEAMKKHFNSPAWKKQIQDMQKQGEEMKKQFNNPEWKKQMQDMQKQGEEMRKKFTAPEWKKQMEDIQKQGEELRKQFSNKHWYLKDSTNNIYQEKPEQPDKKEQQPIN